MPVGDCENAFFEAARKRGVQLVRYKKPWLNQRGHFGLPDSASAVALPLEQIFTLLGGNVAEQSAKRLTPLPGDFMHEETGTLIEVDEMQHFTSFRLQTFSCYGVDSPLGYDVDEYASICKRYARSADKYRQTKPAIAFGIGGRQRQRAYYDALRDLATPAMGHPPLVRVPAVDGNGKAAFERNRERILDALG
ncbi:DUF7255 family protein [Paenarthrobacter aromaticivorans]|uniref:Uncharacterized protein n=1 Tax=Paenarthrobacter aromaticivorans TaxID=2849150 RepID=A0ABS6I4G4_9MICC|nr:hypothetical protein [Paenarthrobacter sp. MMS21-TAE1-1]MBU8866623.1 hypothetical protein [Paenarthrobacter sp. MMS21-TAE1-1]